MNQFRLDFLGKTPVEFSDPRQAKVQIMLDRIHQQLSQHHPAIKDIPKPQAIVLVNSVGDPDASLNAAAWDGGHCYNLAIETKVTGAEGGSTGTYPLRLNTAGGSLDRQWTPCDQALSVRQESLASLQSWLQFHLPSCLIEVRKPGLIFRDQDQQKCPMAMSAKQLQLPHMLNWISVDAGLLKNFSEAEIYAVLAHEVSHYYRAHTVQPLGAYSYFFANDRNRVGKPLRDPQMDEKGRKILEAVKQLRIDRKVEGSVYPPLLLAIAGEAYIGLNFSKKGYCSQRWYREVACTNPCNALHQLAENRDYFTMLDLIAAFDGDINPVAYLNAEKVAVDCFHSLTFKNPGIAKGFIDALNLQQKLLKLPPLSEQNFTSLHEYGIALNVEMPRIVQEHNAPAVAFLQDAAIDQDLGFYSKEVEADELGLEIYLRMGFDPKVMIETFVKLAEDETNLGVPLAFGEVGGKECRKLMDLDWSKRPPIARMTDEHLSPCYRAFNIAEELRRHREYYQGFSQP